jgi:ribonuclease HI
MNLTEKELAKKIVQHIASELNAMNSLGDLKWFITHQDRQKHFRKWAEQTMNFIKNSADEKFVYVGHFDGSSKPNPGIMKIGGNIKNLRDMSTAIYSFSILLDYGTNNRAEYLALIELLEMGIKKGIKRMNIYGDSKLAVMQVNHKWKANKDMAPLRDQVLKLLNNFDHWSLSHVPRALNSEADLLTR